MENRKEEKDEKLVALAQTGDKLAMDELLRRHFGTVRSCARRYFLLGGEAEDVVQEDMIGLYHAINDYDGTKGSSFKNFAYLCISRQIVDAVKTVNSLKAGMRNHLQPLDAEMVETGLSPEELLILSDEQKEFRQKMSKELSDFEFKVTTTYMDGATIAEICEATGKPYKSVDNALQRSKRKLIEVFKR